jgi:serine/threonine-protein kinase
MGTPLYMAPEAISGTAHVDARSDLYALGAVGYFLLTGTPVFTARTIVEICAHHLHTPPEPPSARSGLAVPPALERVILQCLAKSPADRPKDARTLGRALAAREIPDPWSEEDAARWWARFRSTRKVTRVEPDPSRQLTAVVDLANRVNQFR